MIYDKDHPEFIAPSDFEAGEVIEVIQPSYSYASGFYIKRTDGRFNKVEYWDSGESRWTDTASVSDEDTMKGVLNDCLEVIRHGIYEGEA